MCLLSSMLSWFVIAFLKRGWAYLLYQVAIWHFPSEVSQQEKNKYHVLMHVCGIWKNGADEAIHRAGTAMQIQRTDMWARGAGLKRGGGGTGGWGCACKREQVGAQRGDGKPVGGRVKREG